jgi:peptidoglycan hydrolase-like protein with peptidoglycan-binding domain
MENNILAENTYGHGAIKDTEDERDYQFSDIASATAPFDWNTGFDIETKIGTMPVKNQFQSFSCGGQAWSSYSYALEKSNQEKSAKFIYAQTHQGSGGSDGRTNSQLCVSKGDSSETLCSSYLPDKTTTEAYMTNVEDITALAYADALTNEEKSYLAVNCNIDLVAQAIRDSNGVVIGLTGVNNGTWLTAFPLPPEKLDNTCWNHWLYFGKAKLINGKKYLGFLNSWGTSVGQNGWQWISEDYFNIGIFACWTMMYNSQIKYIFVPTIKFGDKGLPVKMLQTRLGITADGIFGAITKQAVQTFQVINKLVPDSIVGIKTCNALNQ